MQLYHNLLRFSFNVVIGDLQDFSRRCGNFHFLAALQATAARCCHITHENKQFITVVDMDMPAQALNMM